MLGTFGFSYIGFLYLLMLFIPNILWTKRQPEGYQDLAQKENKVLFVFERVGQVLTAASAVLFQDYNWKPFSPWTAWLIVSFFAMLLYEICWVRYFKKPTLKNFYGKFLFIPLPLATLPVLGFFLLGIYGKVIWLMIAALLLGIGHIGIHWQHQKTIQQQNKK